MTADTILRRLMGIACPDSGTNGVLASYTTPSSRHQDFSSLLPVRSIITSSLPSLRLSSARSSLEGAAPTQSLSGIISVKSNLNILQDLLVIRMTVSQIVLRHDEDESYRPGMHRCRRRQEY